MHELSIAKYIVETVQKSFDPETMERVNGVKLAMGAMRDYECEWLQKYFDALTEDTVLAGAKLTLRKIPVSFKCRECGKTFPMDQKSDSDVGCPECGSYNYDMVTGREFLIESIEVETKDDIL